MKTYKSPVSTSAVVYKSSAKHTGFDGFSRGLATAFSGDHVVSNSRLPQKLQAVKRS